MRGIVPSLRFLCGLSILMLPQGASATPPIIFELSSLVSRLLYSIKRMDAAQVQHMRSWGRSDDTADLLMAAEFLVGITQKVLATSEGNPDPAIVDLSEKSRSLAALLEIDSSALSREVLKDIESCDPTELIELAGSVRAHVCKGEITKLFECFDQVKALLELILQEVCDINPSSADTLCCSILLAKMEDLSDQVDSCCSTLSTAIEPIEPLIESCCSQLGDQLDRVEGTVTSCCSTLSEQIEPIVPRVNSCCSALSDKIQEVMGDREESCCSVLALKLDDLSDQVDSCCTGLTTDIEPLEPLVVSCCSVLSEKIQLAIAEGDSCCNVLTQKMDDLSEQVDSCCTGLAADIEPLEPLVVSCCSVLTQKIQDMLVAQDESCCSVLSLKLDNLSDQVDSCCSALSTEIEPLEPAVDSCCSVLTQKIQDMLVAQDESCCSVLSLKLDDLSNQVDSCCSTLSTEIDPVEEAVDSCCSVLDQKIQDILVVAAESSCSVLTEQITVLTEQIVSGFEVITTDIDPIEPRIESCCSALSEKLQTDLVEKNGSCCSVLTAQINNVSTEVDICCSRLADQIATIGLSDSDVTTVTQKDIDSGFTITEAGTYVLCQNVTFTDSAAYGITITGGDGVVIDLNGHLMDGQNVGLKGIGTVGTAGATHVTIKNGAIINAAEDGLDMTSSSDFVIQDMQLNQNGDNGLLISASNEGLVMDVQATANTGSGMNVEAGSTRVVIRDCNCDNNTVDGFNIGGIQNIVRGSGAMNNGAVGFDNEGSISGTPTNVGESTNQFYNNYAGCNTTAEYDDVPSNVIEATMSVNTDTTYWANVDLGCQLAT